MRTIKEYGLDITPGVQERLIPGWGGIAAMGERNGLLSVWCHIDERQQRYRALFVVTASGEESPSNKFVFAGSVICDLFVAHVWRNAMTEKVDE